jgi:RNA polymerase subunit RPABC4/transcription elongation factor Spt4
LSEYSDKLWKLAYERGKAEARPQGHWIKHIDNLYPEDSTEECPFCHEEQRLVGNDDNFCPNCGADMRGGRE